MKGHCSRKQGFTVIELLISLVVVAILAAVAYPAYVDQLAKGRRAAAQAFLTDLANRQQQYLLDARNYAVGANALTTLNVTVPADVASHYTVTVGPNAPTIPPTFMVTATPVSGTKQVADGVLTLDNTGSKTRAGHNGW